jgi:cation diffusion facilitator CzcD-associated flavoprotein CzcO
MSNSYYPTLAKPNVTVHPTAVTGVEGGRVLGADGSAAEVDAIIFGTGFHILDMPLADRVVAGDGRSLADVWQGSPKAYLGTAISGFPNLFLLLGPNLGTGHSSAFAILEAQLAHVIGAVGRMRRAGWATLDVRPEAQDEFNARVQAALPRTVYNSGGCSSYYLDVNGRNSFSWPWSTGRLRAQVGRFDPDAYLIDAPSQEPAAAS